MKNLLEVLKANKKNIVRGALLLGGTIVTAYIANVTLRTNENEFEVIDSDSEQEEVNEVEVETTEEYGKLKSVK